MTQTLSPDRLPGCPTWHQHCTNLGGTFAGVQLTETTTHTGVIHAVRCDDGIASVAHEIDQVAGESEWHTCSMAIDGMLARFGADDLTDLITALQNVADSIEKATTTEA